MNSKIGQFLAALCVAVVVCSSANSEPLSTADARASLPASAQPPHGPALAGQPLSHPPATPRTDQGAGFFVYPLSGGQNVGSASVQFRIPPITCHSASDQEWLLPGIWVFSAGVLTQQVDVNLNCNDNSKLLEGVVCINGGSCDSSMTVSAGDRVVATLSETAGGTFGQLHNLTTGQKTSVSGPATTSDDVVLVGVIGPDWFVGGAVTKVPTFSSVPFSKVQINGYYLKDAQFPTGYNLATTPNRIQIAIGPIGGDGDYFVTAFKQN